MKVAILDARHVHGVTTEADYRARHAMMVKQHGRTVWEYVGPPILAYVNHARWLCACPNCDNAPAVSVDWRLALCFGCGAVIEGDQLVLPSAEAVEDLEDVLGERPERHRNWRPGEQLEDLDRENVAHGLLARAEVRRRAGKPARAAARLPVPRRERRDGVVHPA